VSLLRLRRVILFVRDMKALTAFYRDVLGLPLKDGSPEEGWVDFEGDGCSLALHRGTPRKGATKIAFWSHDIEKSRAELLQRGATLGKTRKFGDLTLCDGRDPEGNLFQLSSRR